MPIEIDDVVADAEEKAEEKKDRTKRWRSRWGRLKFSFKLVTILALIGMVLWHWRNDIFITVESGEVMIVYYRFFGGTNHNHISHEGLHIVAPWDRVYRYKIRTQTIVIPMTILSRNGLEVHLDAQLRFHVVPETVPYLHRRYGPDYSKEIIVPELIESIQQVIGRFLPEELYSVQRTATVAHIFSRARRSIGGVYFQLEDISLFNVKLPSDVQESIQAKAVEEQKSLAYDFRLQSEEKETQRKLMEARGLEEFRDIVKGIPQSVLTWKGIEATLELAKSPNAKVIVIGGGKEGLPLVLGNVPDVAGK